MKSLSSDLFMIVYIHTFLKGNIYIFLQVLMQKLMHEMNQKQAPGQIFILDALSQYKDRHSNYGDCRVKDKAVARPFYL